MFLSEAKKILKENGYRILSEETENGYDMYINAIKEYCTDADKYYKIIDMLCGENTDTRISMYGLQRCLFDNKFILAYLDECDESEITDSDVPKPNSCRNVMFDYYNELYSNDDVDGLKELLDILLVIACEDHPDALVEILEYI